jgi:spore maturation protein SpmA
MTSLYFHIKETSISVVIAIISSAALWIKIDKGFLSVVEEAGDASRDKTLVRIVVPIYFRATN